MLLPSIAEVGWGSTVKTIKGILSSTYASLRNSEKNILRSHHPSYASRGTCAWHPRRHGRWRVIIVRDRLQALSYRNSNLYIRYLSLSSIEVEFPSQPASFLHFSAYVRYVKNASMWQPTWQRLYNLIYEARFGVSVHPSFPDIHVINDFFTMPPWGILATWFQMPAWTKHSSLVRRDFWLLGWEISQQQKATTFDTHVTSSKKNISTIRIAIFYLFQNPTHTHTSNKNTHTS